VLVVEDDADIRTILAVFLGDKGFNVKVADSGHRALELLKSWQVFKTFVAKRDT